MTLSMDRTQEGWRLTFMASLHKNSIKLSNASKIDHCLFLRISILKNKITANNKRNIQTGKKDTKTKIFKTIRMFEISCLRNPRSVSICPNLTAALYRSIIVCMVSEYLRKLQKLTRLFRNFTLLFLFYYEYSAFSYYIRYSEHK